MNESIYPKINSEILEAIKNAKEAIVIGHKNPDGDCISSELAVGAFLEHLGIHSYLINEGPFQRPEINCFAPFFRTDITDDILERDPLVIVVDCSTGDRPGDVFKKLKDLSTILVFDHHSSGEPFTKPEYQYIVTESVSTTLVLEQLRQALNIPLTKELAEHLFFGFMTDTGFFHFMNEKVAGESLRLVSQYADAGVSMFDMYNKLHSGKSLEFLQLVSSIVNRTEHHLQGRVYTTEMYKEETSGPDKPADTLYSLLMQIDECEVLFFFKENEGSVEIGMRSQDTSNVDVGAFASSLGGGGHRNAAGATVMGTLSEVKALVLEKVKKILD